MVEPVLVVETSDCLDWPVATRRAGTKGVVALYSDKRACVLRMTLLLMAEVKVVMGTESVVGGIGSDLSEFGLMLQETNRGVNMLQVDSQYDYCMSSRAVDILHSTTLVLSVTVLVGLGDSLLPPLLCLSLKLMAPINSLLM